MDSIVVYIPLIIVFIVSFHMILRYMNKVTVKKAAEKDWKKKQAALKKKAAQRRSRMSCGTSFKDKLVNNPNEKKWNRIKKNPRLAKKLK